MHSGALCSVLLALLAVSATAETPTGTDAELRAADSRYLEAMRKIDDDAAQARRQEFEKLRNSYRLILESNRAQAPAASRDEIEQAAHPALDQPVVTDEWAIWSLFRGIPQEELVARCVIGLLICAAAIAVVGLAIIAAARRRVINGAADFCRGTVKVRLGTCRIDRKVPQQLVPTRWGSFGFSLREPWLVRVSFNIFSKKTGRYVLCCHWGLRQWDLIGVQGAERHIPVSNRHGIRTAQGSRAGPDAESSG